MGRGKIQRYKDEKSEKWNIGQRTEIRGMKGGLVEGVKRAEGKGRGGIQRKVDEKSEKWNIGGRD